MKKLGFTLLATSVSFACYAADLPDASNLSDYCQELTDITDMNAPACSINTSPHAQTLIDQKLFDHYANTPETASAILRPIDDGYLPDNYISDDERDTPAPQTFLDTHVNLEKPPACLTHCTFAERQEIVDAAYLATQKILRASADQEVAKEIIQEIKAEYPAFRLALQSGCFNADFKHATKQWLKLEDVTSLHHLGTMLQQLTKKRKRRFFATQEEEAKYAAKQLNTYCENSTLFAQAYENGFFTPENIPLLQRLIDGDIHDITLKRPNVRAERKQELAHTKEKNRTLKLAGSKDKKRIQLRRARSKDMKDITNENEPQP